MNEEDFKLQELKDKIIVSRALIIHSIEGKYTSALDFKALDEFLDFHESKIEYFDYSVSPEPEVIGEGKLTITILNNIEFIKLTNQENNFRSKLWLAFNNRHHRIIILSNSENLYLLDDYLDSFPDLLDKIFQVDGVNSVFKRKIPTRNDFKDLLPYTRKYLVDKVAVHKMVYMPSEDDDALIINLYNNGYLALSHFRNNSLYFALNSGTPVSKAIEKKSNGLYSKIRRSGLLKFLVLAIISLIVFALSVFHFHKVTIDQSKTNDAKTIRTTGKFQVSSSPKTLINTYIEYGHKNDILNLFEPHVPEKVDSSYLYQVFNAYPLCPAPVELSAIPPETRVVSESQQSLILKSDEHYHQLKYDTNDNLVLRILEFEDLNSTDHLDEQIIFSKDHSKCIVPFGNMLKIYEGGKDSLTHLYKAIDSIEESQLSFDSYSDNYTLDQFRRAGSITKFAFWTALQDLFPQTFRKKEYANQFLVPANRGRAYIEGSFRFHFGKDGELAAVSGLDSKKLTLLLNADPSIKAKRGSRAPILNINLAKNSNARALDSDSLHFFVGCRNNQIYRYSFERKPVLRLSDTLILRGHNAAVSNIVLFKDKQLLASQSETNEIILWDYDGRLIHEIFMDPGSELSMYRFGEHLIVIQNGMISSIPVKDIFLKGHNINFNKKRPPVIQEVSGRSDKQDTIYIERIDSSFNDADKSYYLTDKELGINQNGEANTISSSDFPNPSLLKDVNSDAVDLLSFNNKFVYLAIVNDKKIYVYEISLIEEDSDDSDEDDESEDMEHGETKNDFLLLFSRQFEEDITNVGLFKLDSLKKKELSIDQYSLQKEGLYLIYEETKKNDKGKYDKPITSTIRIEVDKDTIAKSIERMYNKKTIKPESKLSTIDRIRWIIYQDLKELFM